MISSKVAFYITYTLYLLGKYKYNIHYKRLESLIRKWFVFSQLTTRYTGSPESVIEDDLKSLESLNTLDEFVRKRIETRLTHDFWEITLPHELESSSTSNYAFQVYNAALVYFDTTVLFSDIKLRDFLKPSFVKTNKNILDLHHIYPKEYLKKLGLTKKDINQVANLIYLEYKDNISINDTPPQKYWPQWISNFYGYDNPDIYKKYDLPEKFYELPYKDFLNIRRKLMARKIREYFDRL